MSAIIKEKKAKRMQLVTAARTLADTAKKENRDLTEGESTQVDNALREIDAIDADLKVLEAAEVRMKRLQALEEESRGRQTNPTNPGNQDRERDREERGTQDQGADPQKAYSWTLERRGRKARTIIHAAGTPAHRRHLAQYRDAWRSVLGLETRGLQSDLDTDGGYLVAPEQWVGELLRDVDDETVFRQMARTFTTTAQSIGVPKRTAKAATFAWGGELTSPTADTALKFGKRSLTPHYMTGLVQVSRDLLRAGVMDVDAIVREEIARDSGELEERAFMTGNGAGQPLGIFTASADGISTSRDVSNGNTTTAITWDGLIRAKFSLKEKYRMRASWIFHRDAVAQIRLLKDGNGQYLWQPSLVAGEPDRILNLPVRESEWVPNTFTTGLYVGALGDWSNYWIVDGLDLGMQILNELYAANNQVGYIVRRKVDGAPTIEEAFARVKLA